MKLFAVLAPALIIGLTGCESKPLTQEQLAEKENCVEVTGSRLPRCGNTAMRDAGIKTMDADTARRAIGSGSTTGPGPGAAGGR